jgi:DNA-binding transcriptional ArsR family regulator
MEPEEDAGFDRAKAELFEAMGHPLRIRILQALEQRHLGFSELKRSVGIESSGHLAFHLGKMSGLVKTTETGDYVLTDDGREALRMVQATRGERLAESAKISVRLPGNRRALLAVLVAGIILLASFAAIQQMQIAALDNTASSQDSTIAQLSSVLAAQQSGSVLLGSQRYWYATMSSSVIMRNGTAVSFHGVTFDLRRMPRFVTLLVTFPNGTLVTFKGFAQPVEQGNSSGTSGYFSLSVVCQRPQGGNHSLFPCAKIPSAPPAVEVTFPDGTAENSSVSGATTVPVGLDSLNITAGDYVWFSTHTNPQAGIAVDNATKSVILFVSVP